VSLCGIMQAWARRYLLDRGLEKKSNCLIHKQVSVGILFETTVIPSTPQLGSNSHGPFFPLAGARRPTLKRNTDITCISRSVHVKSCFFFHPLIKCLFPFLQFLDTLPNPFAGKLLPTASAARVPEFLGTRLARMEKKRRWIICFSL
jgi:hypothetical protein